MQSSAFSETANEVLELVLYFYLLAGYIFGCHAFPHLSGGKLDCFSCPSGKQKTRYKLWKGVSWLNREHMFWAWASMIWVAFADIYVRMVAVGTWTDYNTWGY